MEDYKAAFESYLKSQQESGCGFYAEMLEENGLKSPFKEGTIQEIVKAFGNCCKKYGFECSPGGDKKWRGKNSIWKLWMWRFPAALPRRWKNTAAIRSWATARPAHGLNLRPVNRLKREMEAMGLSNVRKDEILVDGWEFGKGRTYIQGSGRKTSPGDPWRLSDWIL
ncbi:MAG: hypothetical protein ACLR6B_09655 [Blautia sp.]